MAISGTFLTTFGEERELYVRLNNFDQLANHGVPAVVRFRGFLSREAYLAGSHYVFEQLVEFAADVAESSDKIWPQAYAALKAQALAAVDELLLSLAEDEEFQTRLSEQDPQAMEQQAAVGLNRAQIQGWVDA